MRTFATIVFLAVATGEAFAEPPVAPCCAMSEEARAMIRGVIPLHLLYPGQDVCPLGSHIPIHALQQSKASVLPCLLDIYLHGVSVPEPCKPGRAVDGKWALHIIKSLDERMAIGLLEGELLRSPHHQVPLKQQLVLLGERRYLGDLLDFVESTSLCVAPSLDAAQRDAVLEAIAAIDARGTVPRLRTLREKIGGTDWMLDAVIAQLERDEAALIHLGGRPPGLRSFQALAILDRLGAEDAALVLLEHRAAEPMTKVSATNEIAARKSRQRGALLLHARRMTPATVAMGEQIEIELRIQNVSPSVVTLPARCFPGLRISAIPTMRQLSPAKPPQPSLPGAPPTLAPGETFVFMERADLSYSFDPPGRYGITATLDCHGGGTTWTGHLESPWIEVLVNPPLSASVGSRPRP